MLLETKDHILMLLQEQQPRLRQFGVRRYGLFGSFVRDEAHPDSDIDLLVEFYPGEKTFDNFMGLSFFLEDLFDRRVEIVTPESLSPYIGPSILREAEYATISP